VLHVHLGVEKMGELDDSKEHHHEKEKAKGRLHDSLATLAFYRLQRHHMNSVMKNFLTISSDSSFQLGNITVLSFGLLRVSINCASTLRFLVPDGGSFDADEHRPQW
jgi:hypothetical protein